MKKNNRKKVLKNRKAFFMYTIIERVEAGIVLVGTEIKSIREGKVSFKDSYARFHGLELFLEGLYIAPYKHGTYSNHEPERQRKLLLHKKELKRLRGKVEERGCTIVPLFIYITKNLAKVEIGLVKGKRLFDRREEIKKRDLQREMQRDFKERYKR